MIGEPDAYPELGLVPRADRLLVHYFPEMVRDFISSSVYLRLPLEAKGLLQVIRHHLLHAAVLPNDVAELAWLTREPKEAIERWLPVVLASGIIANTPDDRCIYCPALEPLIRKAANDVKRLKRAGQKGGMASATSRNGKKDAAQAMPNTASADVPL